MIPDKVSVKFWAKVSKDGPTHPVCGVCWVWTGKPDADGYGRLQVDKYRIKSHRLSWILHRGKIPRGLCVLHMCDTPICVNPNHLFLGTNLDNIADRHRKGRTNTPKGELAYGAKLTETQIREIRKRHKTGGGHCTGAELSREFKVSQATISLVVNGKHWKSVL